MNKSLNLSLPRRGLPARVLNVLGWVVRLSVFVLVLGFALKNSQPVVLNGYFGQIWETPLVLLLLAALCLGALLGVLALLPMIFRLRRERRAILKTAVSQTSEGQSQDGI